tara:strand:+ start:359 stop:505 length:147 start_codon:yes stop_codon:yes gene_type:complete
MENKQTKEREIEGETETERDRERKKQRRKEGIKMSALLQKVLFIETVV